MTRTATHLGTSLGTSLVALGASLLAGAPLHAQGSASAAPRFQAFVGCWSAEQTTVTPAAPVGPIVCILPTSDANAVDVATIHEGKVTARETLDASGRDRPIDAKGCVGTRRATWSQDSRRVYLRSVATCGGVSRGTSGILAITPSGEWLDVQGVAAGEGSSVRVARYRDVGVPRSAPAEIANAVATALGGRELANQSARIAAGAPVKLADVVEATRAADSAVVEAWILERAQTFALTGRDLKELARAGVPARVTDALVAVSNPEQFELARAAEDEDGRRRGRGPDIIGSPGYPVYPDPYDTPWGWGYYGGSPYYGGRRGYGGGYYPGFYNPPVVVVSGGGHGKMVKGEGYTQGEGRTANGTSEPRTTKPASSTGSTSKAPDSKPSTPARTAKPRD